MLAIREIIGIFTGRTSIESFSTRRIDLAGGALTFSLAFVIVSLLLSIEALIAGIANWAMSKGDMVSLLIIFAIVVFGALFGTVLLLIAQIIAVYLWGAVHFYLAKLFSNKPDNLTEFNSVLLCIFAATTLAAGLFMLIPLVGWVFALLVQAYGIVLMFRFVKSRFNLTDAQAAIVVLAPIDALLLLVFIASVILSFALVG